MVCIDEKNGKKLAKSEHTHTHTKLPRKSKPIEKKVIPKKGELEMGFLSFHSPFADILHAKHK